MKDIGLSSGGLVSLRGVANVQMNTFERKLWYVIYGKESSVQDRPARSPQKKKRLICAAYGAVLRTLRFLTLHVRHEPFSKDYCLSVELYTAIAVDKPRGVEKQVLCTVHTEYSVL